MSLGRLSTGLVPLHHKAFVRLEDSAGSATLCGFKSFSSFNTPFRRMLIPGIPVRTIRFLIYLGLQDPSLPSGIAGRVKVGTLG